MGKNLNPADAYRKSLRKKELKKNKAERSKARDFALVKKDTRDLEDEIEKLEGLAQPSSTEKSRLSAAKAELEKINTRKEEYVKEHPEQRRLVYRPRRDKDDGKATQEIILPKKRNYFDKNGLPRHPERSIYYDKIMNPYGVAPPGMPYMERPLLPGEVDSEAEEDEDDDDIAMPEGPPPGLDEPVNSDDEIPMPDEPAAVEQEDDTSQPPLPQGPTPPLSAAGEPPLPPGPPPVPAGMSFPPQQVFVPPPPPGFPSALPPGSIPPPPVGFPTFPPNLHSTTGFPQSMMPPPPPGFFPRQKSASAMQDPLSNIPHQTYQAHRASRLTGHPSLPPKPITAETQQASTSASTSVSATVFAAPQLRDLKKEATAFVPSALKRKRGGGAASSSRIDAAPGIANDEEDPDSPSTPGPTRPDLLGTLRNQFGPAPPVANAPKKAKVETAKKRDDYERFVEEIGDILNPAS